MYICTYLDTNLFTNIHIYIIRYSEAPIYMSINKNVDRDLYIYILEDMITIIYTNSLLRSKLS